MRAAILISGFMRGYRETFPFWKSNLYSRLYSFFGGNVDIIISAWKMTDRGTYPEWISNPHEEMKQYYNPAVLDIEENFSFNHRFYTAFYKMHRTFQKMVERENKIGQKYDFVVRDRSDNVHARPIPTDEVQQALDNPDLIRVPRMSWCPSGLSDLFAYGGRPAMERYFSCFEKLKDEDFHPELTLFKNMGDWCRADERYQLDNYRQHFSENSNYDTFQVYEENGKKFRLVEKDEEIYQKREKKIYLEEK